MGEVKLEKLRIDEINEKFENYKTITIDDFYDFYKDIYLNITRSTVRWYVAELKRSKIIRNIARGQYVLENIKIDKSDEYIVITADIISSSKIEYSSFNSELAEKVEKLNEVLKEVYGIVRKYHISQGDEIQIIYPMSEGIKEILITTITMLRPYEIRYSISYGSIKGELIENSWEMNGPIYWNARDQIENLKKSKSYSGKIISNYKIADNWSNRILELVNKTLSKITKKQWEVIKYDIKDSDIEIALRDLDISKTSYYDRMNTSMYKEVMESLGVINEIMKRRKGIE